MGGICLCGAHGPLHARRYNNVGSGYWGNDFTAGSTFYLTKDQGTTANIMGNWETHGSKTTRIRGHQHDVRNIARKRPGEPRGSLDR